MTDHAYSAAERQAIYRVIGERRDMRRFVPDAVVADDVLARLLVAAHSAPSVGLMQPWRFIRVTDTGLRAQIHALRLLAIRCQADPEVLALLSEAYGEAGKRIDAFFWIRMSG